MSELTIKPVATRRERKQFLNFPWSIYKGNPHWIPPLRGDQAELAGYKKHPFHETAEIQTFLATRGGTTCGRIAAIINHPHNELHNDKVGFFGFFESIDDAEVATGLFDAAGEWLAERGCTGMRGPTSPSINYTSGLLIDSFDQPPAFLMAYNPPYYQRLIEDYGFTKGKDLYALYGTIERLSGMNKKLPSISAKVQKRFGLEIHTMDRSLFKQQTRSFLDIYNKSYNEDMWSFCPLTDAEMEHMSAGLRHLLVPELIILARRDGETIGCTLALLDFNPVIKKIDGRLFPFGFIRLLSSKKKINKIRVLSINVLPKYQSFGLGVVLMLQLAAECLKYGIYDAELSWIMESNHLSLQSIERAGAIRDKTYRLYDYDISR